MATSIAACVRVLLGEAPPAPTEAWTADPRALRSIEETRQAHQRYWPCLRKPEEQPLNL